MGSRRSDKDRKESRKAGERGFIEEKFTHPQHIQEGKRRGKERGRPRGDQGKEGGSNIYMFTWGARDQQQEQIHHRITHTTHKPKSESVKERKKKNMEKNAPCALPHFAYLPLRSSPQRTAPIHRPSITNVKQCLVPMCPSKRPWIVKAWNLTHASIDFSTIKGRATLFPSPSQCRT